MGVPVEEQAVAMGDEPSSRPDERQVTGERRATIADVAREAGVSATTVSHALSGRRPVENGTRRLIADAVERLGYVPDARARGLRTGQADAIAILSSMPAGVSRGPSRLGFLMEIAAAAAATAWERGLALVLVPPAERTIARYPDRGGMLTDRLPIGGALVIEPTADDPEVEALLRRGIPVVTIGLVPGTVPGQVASVDLRSADTVRSLLDHLAAEGASRVALLVGAARRASHEEGEAVYRAVAAARGMPPVVMRLDEAEGVGAGRAATLDVMRRHPDVDAICAPVDAFAVGALSALDDLGLSAPGRVRVVTRYDGILARTATPALTAVDLHLDAVASAAVALLFDRMRGGPQRLVTAPAPRLIVRGSSRKDATAAESGRGGPG